MAKEKTYHFSMTISDDETEMVTLCQPTRYIKYRENASEIMDYSVVNCKKCITTFHDQELLDRAWFRYLNQ